MNRADSQAPTAGDSGAPTRVVARALLARLRLALLLGAAVLVAASWRRVCDQFDRWFPGTAPVAGTSAATEYFCPMHPGVVASAPGRCPSCSMPLSKRTRAARSGAGSAHQVTLSADQLALGDIRTEAVSWRPLVREIRASGTLRFDEGGVRRIGTGYAGIVTSTEASVEGATVPRGTPLLRIASSTMNSALEAYVASRRQLAEVEARSATAAIERLRVQTASLRRQLIEGGLSAEQLDAEPAETEAAPDIAVEAPFDCVVLHVEVAAGEPVLAGSPLIHIADPSQLVVVLDMPRRDAALLSTGLSAEIFDPAAPERRAPATVASISPFVDEGTQSVAVRLAVPRDQLTRSSPLPGSRIAAVLLASLADVEPWRSLPRPAEGPPKTVFVCPMHEVERDSPGICGACGSMPLIERQVPGGPAADEVLAVPAGAVIDTGAQQVVFVEVAAGVFEPRRVDVGPRTGGWCPVLSGLAPGVRVAARGAFLLDAEARVADRNGPLPPVLKVWWFSSRHSPGRAWLRRTRCSGLGPVGDPLAIRRGYGNKASCLRLPLCTRRIGKCKPRRAAPVQAVRQGA